MSDEPARPSPIHAPHELLERTLINDFIRARGYDPLKLELLTDEQRRALLADASKHASAKLAEAESRSQLLSELRHGTDASGGAD